VRHAGIKLERSHPWRSFAYRLTYQCEEWIFKRELLEMSLKRGHNNVLTTKSLTPEGKRDCSELTIGVQRNREEIKAPSEDQTTQPPRPVACILIELGAAAAASSYSDRRIVHSQPRPEFA